MKDFRPLYPGLKLALVPLIAALPILEDGDLQSPKTWIKSVFAGSVALYALTNEPPRINRPKPPEDK